jgi:hypothetical protein
MAINRLYTFPTKETGPANCIYDGLYYGDLEFTWNFSIHFPVMTIDYANGMTGKNLATGAGSTLLAEAELLKIARIARSYIFSRVPLIARNHLEYRIAKDEDLRNQILQFQLEILQTWGGYQSLYRVTDGDNQKSIGQAAIDFINGTDVFVTYYTWRIESEDLRSDY